MSTLGNFLMVCNMALSAAVALIIASRWVAGCREVLVFRYSTQLYRLTMVSAISALVIEGPRVYLGLQP